MAGANPIFRLVLPAVFLSSALQAQVAPPPTNSTPPPVPAVTNGSAPAGVPVPPMLTKLFAGNPPHFDPPKPEVAAPAQSTNADQRRNRIIRLPAYIVSELEPIRDEDVITQKGREHAMALRYMGPQNNLDRTLNVVTLADAWKSIPLLGKLPFVAFNCKSYDERAAAIYERIENQRRFRELLDIERVGRKIDDAELTKSAVESSK